MAGKTVFKIPYIGVDKSGIYDLLVGQSGECSVIIKITNPVIRYSAAPSAYDEYHNLMINIVKVLGDGYIIQKQDIISRSIYPSKKADEYLQSRYYEHFAGRDYLQTYTYLTITKQVKKGAFYVYDKRVLADFRQAVEKVVNILELAKAEPEVLSETAINTLVMRLLAMDFNRTNIALNNFSASDTELKMGDRSVRNISLINIDNIDLPPEVSTHIELNDQESLKGFPVDFLSFLFKVPGFETIVFNQVVEIPNQVMTLRKLELKKKRHSGIPDPANTLCVEDIDQLLTDVARENQLLVNSHFNIAIAAHQDQIQKASNFVESALFQLGVIPSKNAYNQLELFRTLLPGNAVELKNYDWFLTTCDAAMCFFFKEALQKDEPSDFLIRFTDRQGIPVGIDLSDLPMRTGRINSRNRFCLGPSGSGKSYAINSIVEQYMLYNMDVVIVDTGHSYSGLCAYYKGKYITYTEQKPITMNPFQITEAEYNIEKKDFLGTLIGLLWKGAEGILTPVEHDVIANVISAYYNHYFNFHPYGGVPKQEVDKLRRQLWKQMRSDPDIAVDLVFDDDIPGQIDELSDDDQFLIDGLVRFGSGENAHPLKAAFDEKLAERVMQEFAKGERIHNQDRIANLSFDTFYEFALRKIPEIKREEQISFDVDEFRYVLKKFYRGGEYDTILNEAADESLFTEPFIVFEIDNVKENKILFPLVTLIIMDVFIQKMRHRSAQRKALIIEEAWKAIASPLMAGYILYLYKTVRKFWGEAIVVTQELADILGNAVVKDSILSNSDTIILLDQSKFKENYKEIAKLLSITETEQKKIFTINKLDNKEGRGRFKEVYIRRGSSGEVYGIEVSIQQYLTYTTEKPEKSAVEIYTNAYGSYPAGLDAFVKDLKESELPMGDFIKLVNKAREPITPSSFKSIIS
jgi:hypothetical protein